MAEDDRNVLQRLGLVLRNISHGMSGAGGLTPVQARQKALLEREDALSSQAIKRGELVRKLAETLKDVKDPTQREQLIASSLGENMPEDQVKKFQRVFKTPQAVLDRVNVSEGLVRLKQVQKAMKIAMQGMPKAEKEAFKLRLDEEYPKDPATGLTAITPEKLFDLAREIGADVPPEIMNAVKEAGVDVTSTLGIMTGEQFEEYTKAQTTRFNTQEQIEAQQNKDIAVAEHKTKLDRETERLKSVRDASEAKDIERLKTDLAEAKEQSDVTQAEMETALALRANGVDLKHLGTASERAIAEQMSPDVARQVLEDLKTSKQVKSTELPASQRVKAIKSRRVAQMAKGFVEEVQRNILHDPLNYGTPGKIRQNFRKIVSGFKGITDPKQFIADVRELATVQVRAGEADPRLLKAFLPGRGQDELMMTAITYVVAKAMDDGGKLSDDDVKRFSDPLTINFGNDPNKLLESLDVAFQILTGEENTQNILLGESEVTPRLTPLGQFREFERGITRLNDLEPEELTSQISEMSAERLEEIFKFYQTRPNRKIPKQVLEALIKRGKEL